MIRKIIASFWEIKLNIKFTIIIVASILIPSFIFIFISFYNMKMNKIEAEISSMEYKISQIDNLSKKCVESANMITQLFIANEGIVDAICSMNNGQEISANELIDIQQNTVEDMQRFLSYNPLLYSVRCFAYSDDVQEIMPIIYQHQRMNKMSWAKDAKLEGWHLGYYDTAFSSSLSNQNDKMLGLVTRVSDYSHGEIGIVEAMIKMETIFPCMYEENDIEMSAFVTDDGIFYFGKQYESEKEQLLHNAYCEIPEKMNGTSYIGIGNSHLIVASRHLETIEGTLVIVRDISESISNVILYRNLCIVALLCIAVLIILLSNFVVKSMLSQLYIILSCINSIQNGNLDLRIPSGHNDEMGELTIQFNRMLDVIQNLMKENVNREILVKDSQIRALQNQINAHFIYNVLESIKMMAEIDEEYEVSDAITSLGKLLRYSMRWSAGNVSLYEEIEYIKNYINLINLRYDFVITLSINITESLMYQEIPKMSIQPIVENAILHGIEPIGVDSTIYIKGYSNGTDSVIEITDTGRGMTAEEKLLFEEKISGTYNGEDKKGNGIGLNNVQNRIKMSFGEQYGIRVVSEECLYTKVIVTLPYRIIER